MSLCRELGAQIPPGLLGNPTVLITNEPCAGAVVIAGAAGLAQPGTQTHCSDSGSCSGSLQRAHTATIPTAVLPQSWQGRNFTSFTGLGRIGSYIGVTSMFSGVIPTFLELTGIVEKPPPEPAPMVEVREAAELTHSLGNVCEGEGRECSTPEIKDACST